MIPVSVVIITKDEEKNIRAALESVKDFEDVVVLDSFSKDRTVDICRELGCRVYQHEWMGYAIQKQMAVGQAKNEWVFILDADERVTPQLANEISQLFNNSPIPQDGFYVPRKNFFLGKWIKHSGWWPDYTLRLFRKERGYIEEREVHERVIVKGSAGYLKGPLEHYTYRRLSDFIKKMEIYSGLAAKEVAKKRKTLIYTAFKMLLSPPYTFFKMFFLQQGFRDGLRGLILAVLYSYYTFLKYAKAWEMREVNNQ